ncbi:CvpA family protein [Planctomicrobium sp. SH661]|uniref:CvpA family protein n=1 Tax=Planctomicrobium sp. SH661 TaxID=3448124 RepID=UPI003F5ADDE1
MIDLLLLAIFGVVVWMVGSDGPWSAAIGFVSVLLSGLVAMNYFEPLANFLQSTVAGSYDWQHRIDIICLLGLFAGGIFALRALGEVLLPTYAELHGLVYQAAQWGFAALAGYVVMAVICTSLHVAPLPREFLGFAPERGNLLGTAPDRQWLALTQYVSEKSMRRTRGDGRPNIFDGAVFPANPSDPATAHPWAAFPIKYATRRQLYASGGAQTTSTPAAPVNTGSAPAGSTPKADTGGF